MTLLQAIGLTFTPVITIFAFFCGVKMADRSDRRRVAHLQRMVMEREDEVMQLRAQVMVLETGLHGVLTKKPADYVIHEEAC